VLKPRAPDTAVSSAGEEDPGASLGDPVLRDAMQGEARAAAEQRKKAQKERADDAKGARKISRK
jgi:hypothetical protein